MHVLDLFEVLKIDVKTWVLEFVALIQPEKEVGRTILGPSHPRSMPGARFSLDFRLTVCQSYLHSFLPCFSPLGMSPFCGIHQSCYSVVESGRQTPISSGPRIELMPFRYVHMGSFENSFVSAGECIQVGDL